MNEALTTAIVRQHFDRFADELIIEEYQSTNASINKLLVSAAKGVTGASKRGTGTGFPDFIIQFVDNRELVIVVECKADTKKHQSRAGDKYDTYAVDGAKLYASYLSRGFDVLAIAVSGQKKSELRVSSFLQMKGATQPTEIDWSKLLTPDSYLDYYLQSPEKYNQDYTSLLLFSKELNDTLHSYKIKENRRALLVSCILIALRDEVFRAGYQKMANESQKNPGKLIRHLVATVLEAFKSDFSEEKGQEEKLNVLETAYGVLTTDTSLSTDINGLCEIITEIDERVHSFMQTYEYFDVLGQLYIEFLRYANSDKGMGIVLTPPHITEFMAAIAGVTKSSVVYDSCTGTGGFLISAMRLMIENAKGDKKAIEGIKKKQLIGVEWDAEIFALVCSNMFIHQDGKTNITLGSCFNESIIEKVKALHPTVGLLNPPYKNKKGDVEELEFVLYNLECLAPGGKTVAIIPMQAALAQSGAILDLKERILREHTLDAVFSMPIDLFINSKVGVSTCIMVFTAHQPHPAGKDTYFGYYKNDGFVKRKEIGRVDLERVFENEIREQWLNGFQNKRVTAGLSVMRAVSPKDEWCAEAYMETDYSLLTQEQFELVVREYTINALLAVAHSDALTTELTAT